jgi:IclR family KDG regulon transcriptional repressor
MSSLDSAIRILRSLSAQKPTLRVSDVSAELDLPKSTASRLLKTLSDGGLLERLEGSRQYSAGPLLLQLGGLYVSTHSVLDLVDRVLAELVESFSFTGYAGILDALDVVVLRQWQGSHPLRLVLDVGSRVPALHTAMGVALLADRDDAQIAAMLGPSAPFERIGQCRRKGWVEVPCPTVPGITAIGAVIKSADRGQPSIGISMSFPDHAADRRLRGEMAAKLVEAVREITDLSTMPLRLNRLSGSVPLPRA